MSRAERLFALYFYLDSKSGRTLSELARRFDVSERTVFRDLSGLEASGVVIEQVDGRYRRVGGSTRPVAFDSGELELVRLALASPAVEKTRGPLGRALRGLVDKLDGALRERKPAGAASSADGDGGGEARTGVREALELAIRESRPVVLRYRSVVSGHDQERAVDPWRLMERDETPFLLGRCHVLEGPRLFGVDRIASVRVGQGRFKAPEDVADDGVREA